MLSSEEKSKYIINLTGQSCSIYHKGKRQGKKFLEVQRLDTYKGVAADSTFGTERLPSYYLFGSGFRPLGQSWGTIRPRGDMQARAPALQHIDL